MAPGTAHGWQTIANLTGYSSLPRCGYACRQRPFARRLKRCAVEPRPNLHPHHRGVVLPRAAPVRPAPEHGGVKFVCLANW